MIKKVLRIDGNSEYEYAKAYIALIDDVIYVNTIVSEYDVITNALIELNPICIRFMRKTGKSESLIQLLDLIRPRIEYYDDVNDFNKFCNVNGDVIRAMKICEITGEDQLNVSGIDGLSVTNW